MAAMIKYQDAIGEDDRWNTIENALYGALMRIWFTKMDEMEKLRLRKGYNSALSNAIGWASR